MMIDNDDTPTKKPEYTGKYTLMNKPKEYEKAVAMFIKGATYDEIRKETSLSFGLLSRIKTDNYEAIEAGKPKLSSAIKTASDMILQTAVKKVEQLNNDPKELSKAKLTELTTSYGILYDKSRLEDGQATNITETKQTATLEDAMDAIKAAQALDPIIDVTPPTTPNNTQAQQDQGPTRAG